MPSICAPRTFREAADALPLHDEAHFYWRGNCLISYSGGGGELPAS
jgi:hypothetical protein